jgi:antitoxin component HigA of HigAB toxin-antitoxin module
MGRNVLYLLLGALIVGTAVLGYLLYQERQKPGLSISVAARKGLGSRGSEGSAAWAATSLKFIGTHAEYDRVDPETVSWRQGQFARSARDYEAALDEIEKYCDKEPKPGTAAADRFDLLALVIADYEYTHWPIEAPDPVDAIRYRMETAGYTLADLGRLLGSRQRASDILSE